jgi:hypothetical protein
MMVSFNCSFNSVTAEGPWLRKVKGREGKQGKRGVQKGDKRELRQTKNHRTMKSQRTDTATKESQTFFLPRMVRYAC